MTSLTPNPPPAPTPGPGTPASLTKSVVGGSVWMIANSIVMRVVSLFAQIALGHLLTKADFGLYGMAMSIAAVLTVLRDGGVRQLLIQRQKEYETLAGPVFWMGATFSVITGLLLLAAGPIAAARSGEPEVAILLYLLAISQPIGALGSTLTAKLQIDMRFAAYSVSGAAGGFVRSVGSILLAWFGFGARSFVIPMIPAAVLEFLIPCLLTREQPWRRRPNIKLWPSMLARTSWVMLGAGSLAAFNIGTSIVIGVFVSKEIVGVYFFAFQIVAQVGVVLGNNINYVLFPAFSKIADDPARKQLAVRKALRQTMLLAAPFSLGLAAVAPALLVFIWHDKWLEAIWPTIISSAAFPIYIILAVPQASQQSRGLFRQWALSLTALCILTLTAAGIGAYVTGTVVGITLISGVVTAIAGLIYTLAVLRSIGVGFGATLAAIMPGWIIAMMAAGAAIWADDAYFASLPAWVRVGISGSLFSVLFGLTARVVVPSHLGEAVDVLPARVRPWARRLLLLPH